MKKHFVATHIRPHKMRGISLVELMVSLAVSALLIAGVFQIYLGNRQSYTTQQGISQVQESGRFATLFMSRSIRHAGYLSDVYSRPSAVYSNAEPPVSGVENGANPDSVTVRYQGQNGAPVLDCFGDAVPVNVVVANQFSLSAPDANGLRSLNCQRLGIDAASMALVDGVQNLQVTYGVDRSDNDVRDTSNYVTANNINAWQDVRSVRLDLTVSDNSEVGEKAFSTTIAIRNRLDDF